MGDALPIKIRITAVEGRGVQRIRLFVDETQSLDQGFSLPDKISPAIDAINRATRRNGGVDGR